MYLPHDRHLEIAVSEKLSPDGFWPRGNRGDRAYVTKGVHRPVCCWVSGSAPTRLSKAGTVPWAPGRHTGVFTGLRLCV